MKKKMAHKILAIALVLLMALPITAFAANADLGVSLTTDATYLRQGYTFNLDAALTEAAESNVIRLTYAVDAALFEVVGYTGPAGTLSTIGPAFANNKVTVTLMYLGWGNRQDLGKLTLKVKDDAVIPAGDVTLSLEAEVVLKSGAVKVIDSVGVGAPIPTSPLQLTSNKEFLYGNEEFVLTPAFREETESNTAILNFTYDKTKFSFVEFVNSNVQVLTWEETPTGLKATVMIPGYGATSLGDFKFLANDPGQTEENVVSVTAEYVEVVNGSKVIKTANADVTLTHIEMTYDLVGLSDLIDKYGKTENDPEWPEYRIYDFNRNGQIDINDISYYAQRIA